MKERNRLRGAERKIPKRRLLATYNLSSQTLLKKQTKVETKPTKKQHQITTYPAQPVQLSEKLQKLQHFEKG